VCGFKGAGQRYTGFTECRSITFVICIQVVQITLSMNGDYTQMVCSNDWCDTTAESRTDL